MEDAKQKDQGPPDGPSDRDVAEIRNALRGIQYGSIQIVVQDGVIIQIDRTEKLRLKKHRRKQG